MNKLVFVVVVAICTLTEAYKPIIGIHGFTGSDEIFDEMIAELNSYQPGHPFFALDIDNKMASMKKLQTLVDDAANLIEKIISENEELFRDGFILLGQSQGGLVSRSLMQQRKWNITKYISTAGVQNGFYGDCGAWFTKNLTCEAVTELMYSKDLQNTFSMANFWRSPDRDLYLKRNLFLPIMNNEEGTPSTPEYQKMLKENFLQAKEYHFFASPDDEILHPWYTSLFQTYGPDMSRVPLEDQYIYQHDTFGLRTAIEQGRVHFKAVPNVKHTEWLNGRIDIMHDYIFPLFD